MTQYPAGEGVRAIQLTERQEKIVAIVKAHGPITSEQIADMLGVHRATLRPDLSVLTLSGILAARPRVGYYWTGRPPRNLLAEEVRRLKVKDVKSVPVVVRRETSVYDAIVAMFTEDVGTLIVVGEGAILEGVISRKDMLRTALGQGDLKKIPVGVIMTRMPNVITTTPEESVWDAAQKLILHEVDALPVVRVVRDETGKERPEVVGRFSKTNVVRVFCELGAR